MIARIDFEMLALNLGRDSGYTSFFFFVRFLRHLHVKVVMNKFHSLCSYPPVFYFHQLPSQVRLLEESIVAQLTFMKFQCSLLYSPLKPILNQNSIIFPSIYT